MIMATKPLLNVLHDNGKTLCFVTMATLCKDVYEVVSETRNCELVAVEELATKDESWIKQRQFIVITSDMQLKIRAVKILESKNSNFFSLVANDTGIIGRTKVGYGSYVGHLNVIAYGEITIGNHCQVGAYNMLSHKCTIGDFCHISHFSRLNQCSIGTGCVLGSNISVDSSMPGQILTVAPYTNILSQSRVSNSLAESGTYYCNRLIRANTSLQERIL